MKKCLFKMASFPSNGGFLKHRQNYKHPNDQISPYTPIGLPEYKSTYSGDL